MISVQNSLRPEKKNKHQYYSNYSIKHKIKKSNCFSKAMQSSYKNQSKDPT